LPVTRQTNRLYVALGISAVLATLALGLGLGGVGTSSDTPLAASETALAQASRVVDQPASRRQPPPPPPPPLPTLPRPAAVPGSAPPPNGLHVGSSGPETLRLEERLSALRYLVGKVDGNFDGATRHGVIAFQKVEGLPRTGVADPATVARLATARTPEPAYRTPSEHIEVDIARQVVFVVREGRTTEIVPTSTGTGRKFTSEGRTRRAITPNGVFQVERKIKGWRRSPLGLLYRPAYFNGGIALHGAPSVPTRPASHGCVRLPMAFADWFAEHATPIGTTVYVHGGPVGENPQPFIDDAPVAEPPVTPAEP
jgi:peptidoglycan hydrolase-like protein with peptidoglycan-binding domain